MASWPRTRRPRVLRRAAVRFGKYASTSPEGEARVAPDDSIDP